MSPWDTWAEYVSQVRNGADNGVDLPRLKHFSQLVGLPILFVAAPAGATLLALRITETIAGDQLTVDFTGTDEQILGFKNSSLGNTYSAIFTALASFLDPNLPHNEGAFRSVDVIAPEGTIITVSNTHLTLPTNA